MLFAASERGRRVPCLLCVLVWCKGLLCDGVVSKYYRNACMPPGHPRAHSTSPTTSNRITEGDCPNSQEVSNTTVCFPTFLWWLLMRFVDGESVWGRRGEFRAGCGTK